MRLFTLMLVAGALGVGGAALAQPELVVDPWGSANADVDSWFGPATNARPAAPAADPVLVDPWQPTREPAPLARRVAASPVAPVTNAAPKSASPPPEPASLVIDPWANVVVSEIPSFAEPRPRVVDNRSPWSGRMIEIVDPWGRERDLSLRERVRLVVDPWAR